MKKNILIIIIISVLFSISYFQSLTFYYSNLKKNMADPVWGLLPKSQTDAETIEEAIARLIAEHETDSGAHTGTGESLETHKSQDAVDHPAGSILADKDTMTEFVIKDDLKSLSGWATTGDITNNDWPGVAFYVEWGVTNESSMFVQSTVPGSFFNTGFNMMFQSVAKFDFSSELYEAWLGMAIDDILPADGFGFIFEDGVTKAIFAIGNVREVSSAITNDETVEHVYRCNYEALTGNALFYIDGVLVATLSKPTGTGNSDVGGSLGVKLTQNNDGNLRIGGVNFARGI